MAPAKSISLLALVALNGLCCHRVAYAATYTPFTALGDFPPLIEATLDDLVTGLDMGLFTSVDLVEAYTARIAEVNGTLSVVTELNPDAASIAAAADARRASGESLGPLDGVPILIKNNIATNDKMSSTAGSYALLGAQVPEDSTVASKLRRAGAVILGKANLSQWANYRSNNSSNGWSAYGGQATGAYYELQDPSGSSSGSGVATSIGLAWAALGTETDGSIVSPSNVNGVVGIKPTVGLTSRYLVIPISEHQDTIGPMARTVRDAAFLLTAIAGKDPKDNYTSAIPFGEQDIPDYVGACDYNALKGKRIGVPRNLFPADPGEQYGPIISAFNASLDVLRQAGATVLDDLYLEGYETLSQADFEGVVLKADFVTNLAEYFATLTVNPHKITDLEGLQNFTQTLPAEEWPSRDTAIWQEALDLGFGNESPESWSNYTANQYFGGLLGITGAIQNHSLDALTVPTAFSSYLPAIIGAPIVTVPLGAYPKNTTVIKNQRGNLNAVAPNIPFGIAFLGEHFSEETLIGIAYAYEQRTQARNSLKPYIEPITELADVTSGRDSRT
ncbi:amidase [Xylariomycetidae sp. FL2044]|nr:amidase [Xylariomycetidae sp. FL2044]